MADLPTLLSPITTTLILSSSEAILALSGLATLCLLALGCSSHLYHHQAVWEKMQEAGKLEATLLNWPFQGERDLMQHLAIALKKICKA